MFVYPQANHSLARRATDPALPALPSPIGGGQHFLNVSIKK